MRGKEKEIKVRKDEDVEKRLGGWKSLRGIKGEVERKRAMERG